MWTTANAVETPVVWPTGMVIVAPLVSVITSGEPVTWFDTCAVIVAVAVPSTTETSSSVTTVASWSSVMDTVAVSVVVSASKLPPVGVPAMPTT